MAEPKQVRVVSRTEVTSDKIRPKKKSRAQGTRVFEYKPFADALRHVTIKEAKK